MGSNLSVIDITTRFSWSAELREKDAFFEFSLFFTMQLLSEHWLKE
jgi:hypothetical protein